jgi:hypothetical protein
MNFIFNDNVRILCLSCNVKKVGKLVRFKQKGQKQASFLAFHNCCQGCLLRGPRYISTSFIYLSAPSAVHSYRVPGKFIRRLKSLFVGWKVYSSSTNKAKIYSYSIFVQQMYWLQDKNVYMKRTWGYSRNMSRTLNEISTNLVIVLLEYAWTICRCTLINQSHVYQLRFTPFFSDN